MADQEPACDARSDPENPAFLVAMGETLERNRELLRRLAEPPAPDVQEIIARQLVDYRAAFNRLAE